MGGRPDRTTRGGASPSRMHLFEPDSGDNLTRGRSVDAHPPDPGGSGMGLSRR